MTTSGLGGMHSVGSLLHDEDPLLQLQMSCWSNNRTSHSPSEEVTLACDGVPWER